jgi:hypothetical protein|tara:strand:- start:195 stop:1544 length:1350 start_codon:yes stop_codon:yes gene_type:complete
MSERKSTTDQFSGELKSIKVASNEEGGRTAELAGKGVFTFHYSESLLMDSVSAAVVYVDTGIVSGESTDNKNIVEGLPIVGTEKVNLSFSDVKGASIDIELYVNKVTPISEDTRKNMVALEMKSKEYILNEKVRLRKRYDGRISDHIDKIMTDIVGEGLGSERKLDIEETSNNYNFIGNNKKPLYTINWLSKKAVSNGNEENGKPSVGFFFYETSEGFHFKSIDGLFAQKPKRSIIYNEATNGGDHIPPRYDYQALEFSKDNLIDAQNKLRMGTYANKLVMFDPFKCVYEEIVNEPDEEKLTLGGKKLPKLNEEFQVQGSNREFSRTTYVLLDKGTLPTGKTEEQIEKSEEENFPYRDILNQSFMRYNQFFAFGATITIPGDFTLHAGDAIFLDVPLLENARRQKESEMDSGLYIITELTHYMSGSDTLTKLGLVRDSIGRKGTPQGAL